MKVSVVTPNYNGLKFLNSYFETLLIQSRFIEEIIIIDNASTDGSIGFIEEFINSSNYPIDIVLIKNQENLGFAPAVNQGIRKAKCEYVYSVNNDVELEWIIYASGIPKAFFSYSAKRSLLICGTISACSFS